MQTENFYFEKTKFKGHIETLRHECNTIINPLLTPSTLPISLLLLAVVRIKFSLCGVFLEFKFFVFLLTHIIAVVLRGRQ